MALVLADRVKETSTTTGTGAYTLAGAVTGFESFNSIGNGNTTYYACTLGSDFEVGIGTYTASGTTLARTTILQSSNSDNAVDWGAGTKTLFCTQPAEKAVFKDANDISNVALNGLSDVTISSVANNDLLKYNSTAGAWQNTNLGVTVDPSLTFPANIFASLSTTVTVAPSSGSYDSISYFAEVRNDANDTTLVTNANITKTATSLTFTTPSSAGTYKLRVKAQDFGDLESEFVVSSFTATIAQPRYYRIYGSGGNNHTMVDDIEFYTGTGQSGTK